MQKNSDQTIACTAGTVRWVSRVAGLRRRYWGSILFFALLGHADHAWSAIPPAPASVTLNWDRSPSAEVAGYRIYYGAVSRSYSNSVVVGDVTNTTVPSLTIGDTYYFAVVAYTASGLESSFSNELLYIVPGGLAQLQIRITANQQAILTVIGQSGHTYQIEATADLKTWAVIGTATLGASGTASYTNTNAGTFTKRFYRTRDTQP